MSVGRASAAIVDVAAAGAAPTVVAGAPAPSVGGAASPGTVALNVLVTMLNVVDGAGISVLGPAAGATEGTAAVSASPARRSALQPATSMLTPAMADSHPPARCGLTIGQVWSPRQTDASRPDV